MSVRLSLIAVTALAVVSDAALIPFYPQFFRSRFGIDSPEHVGAYLAAVCVTVMLAFPIWAQVARAAHPIRLLIWTQVGAGLLCLSCYAASSVAAFWIISLGMIALKASYLLVYPYLVGLEPETGHAGTIGILAVVVQLGAILGALIGGAVVELLDPRDVFLVMAVSDLAQTGICVAILRADPLATADAGADHGRTRGPSSRRAICKLCLVMLLFYFGSYLARPFFTPRWEAVSGIPNAALTGVVFAIPAGVALLALVMNARRSRRGETAPPPLLPALIVGVCGLLLQAAPHPAPILIGRCLYGWALFQATVGLDARLFALSKPEAYGKNFSAASVSQNLGVALSSVAAGSLVGGYGLAAPLLTAAGILLLTALAYPLLVAPSAGAWGSSSPVQDHA